MLKKMTSIGWASAYVFVGSIPLLAAEVVLGFINHTFDTTNYIIIGLTGVAAVVSGVIAGTDMALHCTIESEPDEEANDQKDEHTTEDELKYLLEHDSVLSQFVNGKDSTPLTIREQDKSSLVAYNCYGTQNEPKRQQLISSHRSTIQ